METTPVPHLTPEQIAAVEVGQGFAFAEDPATHRRYLVVDQGRAPTLSDEYFREKVAEGLADSQRGETAPWDVAALKDELRRRHASQQQ